MTMLTATELHLISKLVLLGGYTHLQQQVQQVRAKEEAAPGASRHTLLRTVPSCPDPYSHRIVPTWSWAGESRATNGAVLAVVTWQWAQAMSCHKGLRAKPWGQQCAGLEAVGAGGEADTAGTHQ